MAHKYTKEQGEFITNNVKGRKINELTELVNNYFNLNLKGNQVRAYVKNHGLKSGIDARFEKGHTPFNKGKKGVGGWEPTQFRKGHKPHNYLPVGTERVNGDGYVDIKTADPNKWKGKHILIWEEHNRPIPKGYCIIFGDRDRRNFDIDNLICVSRQQLVRLNQNNLIQNDADSTRTGVVIADIHQKIGERKRHNY